MKGKFMLLMIIFGMNVTSQNVGSEVSFYIERMEMTFVGMKHTMMSTIGNLYNFKLESIVVEYEDDDNYYLNDFNIKTNLHYKRVRKREELRNLKNYRLLYPIYKHKNKTIHTTIIRKRFLDNHISFSLHEEKNDKKNLYLIIYF